MVKGESNKKIWEAKYDFGTEREMPLEYATITMDGNGTTKIQLQCPGETNRLGRKYSEKKYEKKERYAIGDICYNEKQSSVCGLEGIFELMDHPHGLMAAQNSCTGCKKSKTNRICELMCEETSGTQKKVAEIIVGMEW